MKSKKRKLCEVAKDTWDSDSQSLDTPNKLAAREITGIENEKFKRGSYFETFSNLSKKFSIRVMEAAKKDRLPVQCLTGSSAIQEIASSEKTIVVVTVSGACLAFMRDTGKPLCALNLKDEVVRSIHYNKHNKSFITIGVREIDNFDSLQCKSTPEQYIHKKQPENGIQLFEEESLRYPGYVEFDDVNGKILTFSAKDHVYKYWDQKNYEEVLQLPDMEIQEVQTSSQLLMAIFKNRNNMLHFKFHCAESGKKLHSFAVPLDKKLKVELIEQIHFKLFLKVEGGHCLQIYDTLTGDLVNVPESEFKGPIAGIYFCPKHSRFLAFTQPEVTLWSLKGEILQRYDPSMVAPLKTTDICISKDENVMMCLTTEYITICELKTGICLHKIKSNHNVGILHYNYATHEIYAGCMDGTINVHSN